MSRLNWEEPRVINFYWDINSSRELFILIKNKNETTCLDWRAEVLGMTVEDDNELVRLVRNIENITNLTSKQQTSIHNKYLYLKHIQVGVATS